MENYKETTKVLFSIQIQGITEISKVIRCDSNGELDDEHLEEVSAKIIKDIRDKYPNLHIEIIEVE